MSIDWDEIARAISPIKNYEDLCQRLQRSFSYSFVREAYNFQIPGLIKYTQLLLGGDTLNRYTEYIEKLVGTLTELHQAGVPDVKELIARAETRKHLEIFSEQSGVSPQDIATVLKYLVYWVIPMGKYLSGLIREDPRLNNAINTLRGSGIRTNLELLQQGRTRSGRAILAHSSGLPETLIFELVNRADFSRMPWSSKATISNIMGAGYASLAQLAGANPEQLYADFFGYGKVIGKNLKLGNEIENSYRIAKIVPSLVHNE